MGKLILCSGKRTERPYVFSATGTRIYSVEELCYYLYHHVYLIDEAFISYSLIDWIGNELKLSDRADKLKQLKQQHADVKTLVTVILCSADYYSEYEIKSLIKTLDEIIGMPPIRRNIVKADYLLENHQYADAINEYETILDSQEAGQLTPEVYGDLLHNLAVAKANAAGIGEACELFYQAFEHNHREASLRQYFYAVKLSSDLSLFEDKLLQLELPLELSESIQQDLMQWEMEAEGCEGMSVVNQLKLCKRDGRLNEFYRIADEIIDRWKVDIRQS